MNFTAERTEFYSGPYVAHLRHKVMAKRDEVIRLRVGRKKYI